MDNLPTELLIQVLCDTALDFKDLNAFASVCKYFKSVVEYHGKVLWKLMSQRFLTRGNNACDGVDE